MPAAHPQSRARLHWRNGHVLTTFSPIPGTQSMNDLFDQNRRRPDARVIAIRGAREHNLKNVDLELPRDRLVVLTGLSGSGKSSLAFDTIYAEGQRRYVESLSAYARQFLG